MCKKETASLDQELIIPGLERVITWEQFEEPHKSWNPITDYRKETKVILLEGVEEITELAFCSFHDLCSIVIPASVKKIDATAFDEYLKLRAAENHDPVRCDTDQEKCFSGMWKPCLSVYFGNGQGDE